MAKQMVKERQDITRSKCIKRASGCKQEKDQRLVEGVRGVTEERRE